MALKDWKLITNQSYEKAWTNNKTDEDISVH